MISELQVKEVNFDGDILMTAQNTDDVIWVLIKTTDISTGFIMVPLSRQHPKKASWKFKICLLRGLLVEKAAVKDAAFSEIYQK